MNHADALVSEFIDDPDMAAIIQQFVSRLPDQLAAMRDTLAKTQYEDLRRLAHTLKGAGGSYGYPLLTEVSAILENAAKSQDFANAQAALDALTTAVQAVQRGCPTAVVAGGRP
jgi:HPt (histidine-containing phosphotransfer) domain-containing protein